MANDENLGVLIPDILPSQLAAVDVEDKSGKLAQALSELLYTTEELSTGCATRPRKAGIIKLVLHGCMQFEVINLILKLNFSV